MFRVSWGLRNVVLCCQKRCYRRRLPRRAHIPALQESGSFQNDLRQNGSNYQASDNGGNFPRDLKELEFEELDSKTYVEELVLRYLKHMNSGSKQSFKNLSKLEKKLSTENLGENERLQNLFDYLLKESEVEIRVLSQWGPDYLRRKPKEASENPSVKSPDELEDAIFTDLFESGEKEKKDLLSHTDLIYEILSDLNNNKESPGARVLNLEQIVQAFELAKLINVEGKRKRGIFLAGRLLYSLRTVRMDPVNESFYIDSLVNYGFYKEAFELFESNRTKVDRRWWYELGMMIALRANYLNKFDKLFVTTDLRFGQYPYISLQVLRLAVRRKLLVGDLKSADKLTDRFLEMVSIYGCRRSDRIPEENDKKMITFNTEEQADQFLDELTSPSDYDFITLIEYHLFRKNTSTAMKLIAKYLETEDITDNNYRFLIVKLKLYLLKSFEQLRPSVSPHLKPETVQQKLNALQDCFEEVRKEHNLDKTFTQEFFFKNITTLSSFPELAKVMEEFLVKKIATTEEVSPSKKFHALLKVLLATGKQKQAFFLLSKMEEAFVKYKKSPELAGDQFYAEVQPHHYAVFVEYFTLSKDRLPKSMHRTLQNGVEDIIERMENYGVPYNSVLLTKLLIFYRHFNNFNKCFEIINQVIGEKLVKGLVADSDQTRFYNRRDVTRPLYLEIWRTYGSYYKIFHKELERVSKKSNYSGWKMQVSKIIKNTHVQPKFPVRTLFNAMINLDNILPDNKMYYIILTTMMRSRDWVAIPAVLCTMTELHGIQLDRELVSYVLGGLEKELLVVLSRNYQANGQSNEESKMRALSKIKDLKRRGIILSSQDNQEHRVDYLITQILMLLKFKNPEDTQFSDVRDALKELNIGKENLLELIDYVNCI